MVELRPITEDNFLDAFNLKLAAGQEKLVAHPIRSLAQAYVYLLELRSRPEGLETETIRRCLKEKLLLANKNIAHHFEDGYLGDIRLVLLQPETYLLYRDVMVMKGTSASQLKPVHVIRNEFQRRFFFGLQE